MVGIQKRMARGNIAVGNEEYILSTRKKLGGKASVRKQIKANSAIVLRELSTSYKHLFRPKKHALSFENSYRWTFSLLNSTD